MVPAVSPDAGPDPDAPGADSPDEAIHRAMDRVRAAREREGRAVPGTDEYRDATQDLEARASEAVELIREEAETADRSTGAIE